MSAYVDKIKEVGAGDEIQIYANQFVAGEWVNEAKAAHNLTIVGATENTSGGPGDSLTHYLEFDGTDDVAHTADHADLRYTGQNHVSWGGFFWIPATSNSDSFAVLFGKGGSAYEFRQDSTTQDSLRFDPSAGAGISVTGQPTGEWVFYVIRSYASGTDRTELHRRTSGDAGVSQLDLTTASYTEDGNAWKIGARGNPGAFSTFWNGRVAGFFHIAAKTISQTDMNAIYDAAFESAAFNPANLQATVDGSDVTLTWDASF